MANNAPQETFKRCPNCQNFIPGLAVVCQYCGADQGLALSKAAKPKTKMGIGRILLYGVLALFGCGILTVTGSQFSNRPSTITSGTQQSVVAQLPTFTPTATPAATPTPDIKGQAIQIDYKDLARNTESHVENIVYYRGQVTQVLEGSRDRYVLRVAVTPGNYSWDDHLYVHYQGETRLLEDDIIDLWLRIDGRKTYEALLGNQVTIPEATALLVELVNTQAESTGSPQENPIGSRLNPVPVDSAHLAANGNEVRVLSVNYDAWAAVLAANQYNDPPAESIRFVMVEVMVANINGSESESARITDFDFNLVGDKGVLYRIDRHCGVIPEPVNAELFRGGSTTGNFCLGVDKDDTNLLAVYDPSFRSMPPVYFDLPEGAP